MPAWPITVSQELYDAVADPMGEPYADSYLWGAVLDNGKLVPRTVTAWLNLSRCQEARQALRNLNIELLRPAPFGKPGGSQRSWTEVAPELAEARKVSRRRPAYDPW